MKKKVAFITNAYPESGVGSRAYELYKIISKQEEFDVDYIMLDGERRELIINGNVVKKLIKWPGILSSKSVTWIRLARHIPMYDIYDITNQTLSFIAHSKQPSIITVHDIIELTEPQSKAKILNHYLLSGIPKAIRIVAVSEYTKKQIQEYFKLADNVITVIYNGVSKLYSFVEQYSQTIGYSEQINNLKLGNATPLLLFVGSDHPRKNIAVALQVISRLKKAYPNIMLLKIGNAGLLTGRKHTLDTIDAMQLQGNVKILGDITEEHLVSMYRLADVLIYPSLAEGFGLPVLQAMASGCPVVCSNATSLPEIGGSGVIMHDPNDVAGFEESIIKIVEDDEFRKQLQFTGITQAQKFSWDVAVDDILKVYQNI